MTDKFERREVVRELLLEFREEVLGRVTDLALDGDGEYVESRFIYDEDSLGEEESLEQSFAMRILDALEELV